MAVAPEYDEAVWGGPDYVLLPRSLSPVLLDTHTWQLLV